MIIPFQEEMINTKKKQKSQLLIKSSNINIQNMVSRQFYEDSIEDSLETQFHTKEKQSMIFKAKNYRSIRNLSSNQSSNHPQIPHHKITRFTLNDFKQSIQPTQFEKKSKFFNMKFDNNPRSSTAITQPHRRSSSLQLKTTDQPQLLTEKYKQLFKESGFMDSRYFQKLQEYELNEINKIQRSVSTTVISSDHKNNMHKGYKYGKFLLQEYQKEIQNDKNLNFEMMLKNIKEYWVIEKQLLNDIKSIISSVKTEFDHYIFLIKLQDLYNQTYKSIGINNKRFIILSFIILVQAKISFEHDEFYNAMLYFKHCKKILKGINAYHLRLKCYKGLSYCCQKMGIYELALYYTNKYLQFAWLLKNHQLELKCYDQLRIIYWQFIILIL